MRVLIEALGADRPGGGRSATLNLLHALFALDRETRYAVLLSRAERLPTAGPNVRQVVAGPMPALAARLWAQAVLPLYARAWGASLVHHAKNLTVAALPCPIFATVYDLTTVRHPELYTRVDAVYWRHVQPRALGAAARVIAISRTTADDIDRFYGRYVDRSRVEVVYPACTAGFGPEAGDPDGVRRRYGLEGDFVLHVGSISRKKNLMTLARAFARLRAEGLPLRLALVGRVYQKGQEHDLVPFLEQRGLSRDVVFTGPVPDADLPGLYRAASVVAFPSLHEGFGIVPVEAMACGAAVVASTGGALAEAVGDGGLLLGDATDDAELADAIRRVLREPGLRQELRARALRRAAAFSPERTAAETLDVYRRAAGPLAS